MANRNVARICLATTVAIVLLGAAAVLPAQNSVVFLWPNAAPGSENWTQKEAEYMLGPNKEVRNVVKPNITVYLPPADKATGTAVIVAPGGAFTHLAWENEGTKVADWLQAHGVAAFVLKYRLVDTGTDEEYAAAQAAMMNAMRNGRQGAGGPPTGASAPQRRGGIPSMDNPVVHMSVTDSLKAIELVRSRATEWHVDPQKIGIIGFSAGGWASIMTGIEHIAANRPNFTAAIYPCCFNPNNPQNASNLKIPDDAPPLFLLRAYDDGISAASPALYDAWRAAKKPAELHSYAAGGHGFGMSKHNRPIDNWIERFDDWLRFEKF